MAIGPLSTGYALYVFSEVTSSDYEWRRFAAIFNNTTKAATTASGETAFNTIAKIDGPIFNDYHCVRNFQLSQ